MTARAWSVSCLVSVFCVAVANANLHPAGVRFDDLNKTAPEHRLASVPVATGARSFRDEIRVDLSDEVPPIGNQGSQWCCVSWSTAYYHRSQLEYRERHWDLTDPNHQFSPAFTHNQVNGGVDNEGVEPIMSLVCEQGCASMADCPYNQNDYLTWPSESAYSHAIPFRCSDWHWFEFTDTTGLNNIKQLLCNGSTAVLGINVWGNYDNIGQYNNIYCASERTGSNRGPHGVCIVGYDDTLTTNDGPGAFRLTNSWGTSWGDSGFWWMSYVAVLDSLMCLRQSGYLTDTVGYEPKLLGRVHIEHPTRDRVGIGFSVGPRESPLWSKEFRTWREAVQDHPFPDHNIVFDLTEGADYISGGQTDSVYVSCRDCHPDSLGGTIRYMSGQYLPWYTNFASGHTPVTIEDNGTAAHAGARIYHCDHDVSAASIVSPVGIVEPDSLYVPRVEVWNCGEYAATFPVFLAIGTEYADTVQVVSLASHDSLHLEFRAWDPPVYGTNLVRCSTALSRDEYAGNDACTTSVRSRWHDCAVVEILVPPDTVDSGQTVRPKVTVYNYGTQSETFIVTFRIPDAGYERAAAVTLCPDSLAEVNFAPWRPEIPGPHGMSCTLALDGDQVDSNNIVVGWVYVRGSGVAEGALLPLEFTFDQPCPNPSGGMVRFGYALPRACRVELVVYDVVGRPVRCLVSGDVELGRYSAVWDGRADNGKKVAAGVYLYRFTHDDKQTTGRLTLLD
jgi:hypothetical protein